MNLKEFTKTVLTEVITGIQEAQKDEGIGNCIAPTKIGGHDFAKNARVASNSRIVSTIIDFDVAITVENNAEASGGANLSVAGFGLKANGGTSSKDTTVSRVQFAIPIRFP